MILNNYRASVRLNPIWIVSAIPTYDEDVSHRPPLTADTLRSELRVTRSKFGNAVNPFRSDNASAARLQEPPVVHGYSPELLLEGLELLVRCGGTPDIRRPRLPGVQEAPLGLRSHV